MSRLIVILNHGSGGSQRGLDPAEVGRTASAILREAGHQVELRITSPAEISATLERAVTDRPDAVVVGGGDGTVSAAAGALGGTGIALGILPMGTFNLAARDLGIPLAPDAAARFLATAQTGEIDVLRVAGRACLCTAVFGFYPEFSHVFETRDHGGLWWRKALRMVAHLRTAFTLSRSLRLVWEADEDSGSARTKFSAFVPGRYKAAPGLIPARAGFRSGRLSAYVATHRTAGAAVRGIVEYALGRLENDPHLLVFAASAISLRDERRQTCRVMIDGEVLRLRFPIHMEIQPRHLRVFASPEVIAE